MKMAVALKVVIFFICIVAAFGAANKLPGGPIKKVKDSKEAWGYVNIRPDAYMFWWLYYSSANGSSYQERPLVLWLQGGPGASSTGYGNFVEIGSLDVDLKPRNASWVKHANVLFVDNPVGTGFSYTTNESAFATNNSQVASDLIELLKAFLQKLPEFQKIPLYVFSESYGGKMAIEFTSTLYKAVTSGKLVCNFKGVALGDSWISPIDSVLTWAPYLYSTSLVDETGVYKINAVAQQTEKAINSGQYLNATELWGKTENVVTNVTNGVNFYNILKKSNDSFIKALPTFENKAIGGLYWRHVAPFQQDDLSQLMNGPIREKLHVIPANVSWGGQSADVFRALAEDFMKPVTNIVESVLNSTNIMVSIYNGQWDLIVDTLGTLAWVNKLHWAGIKGFRSAERTPVALANDPVVGYVKRHKNLAFYWILNSGHMVPSDVSETALRLLQLITSPKKK